MIKLRVSKRVLKIVVWVVSAVMLGAGLYGLGTLVTPRNSAGRPLVLSPSLRAAERYRARAVRWVEGMVEVDRRLTVLLTEDAETDPTELYTLGREMQAVGEDIARLANEVRTVEVTVALVGLQDSAVRAADAYLETAVLTSRWLCAPSEAGRREALTSLRAAGEQLSELEQSRWLTTTTR